MRRGSLSQREHVKMHLWHAADTATHVLKKFSLGIHPQVQVEVLTCCSNWIAASAETLPMCAGVSKQRAKVLASNHCRVVLGQPVVSIGSATMLR